MCCRTSQIQQQAAALPARSILLSSHAPLPTQSAVHELFTSENYVGSATLLNLLKVQYSRLKLSTAYIEASVAVTLNTLHHQAWGATVKIQA